MVTPFSLLLLPPSNNSSSHLGTTHLHHGELLPTPEVTSADEVSQARNQEKAQSMLYRFREAQAAELGFSTRSDKRPRMASSVKDIRQCEKWRGEIMKEISRKVSKIQDRQPPFPASTRGGRS